MQETGFEKAVATYLWTNFWICQAKDITIVTRETNTAVLYRNCSRQFSVKAYWTRLRKSVPGPLWTEVPRRTSISLKKENWLSFKNIHV